jgi:hypothetical protein
MAAMVSSLTIPEDVEERMSLAQALRRLEAIVGDECKWEATADDQAADAHAAGRATAAVGRGGVMAPVAEEEVEEPRECMLCMSAPRSVRFLCGHR